MTLNNLPLLIHCFSNCGDFIIFTKGGRDFAESAAHWL